MPTVAPCAVRPAFQDHRLYIQEAALEGRELVALAKDCGLDVPESLLGWYLENGYLAPVIEFAVLDEQETPPVLAYSRWQLFVLHQLEVARTGTTHVWSSAPIEEQDRRSWVESLRLVNFAPFMREYTKWLELVILLQNKFVAGARGHRNWAIERRSEIDRDGHDAYLFGSYRLRVEADAPLHEVGLTLDQALALRQRMGVLIWSLDPLKRWYRLVRFVNFEERAQLEGNARLAQELYIADRILQSYLEELTGQPQPDTEDLHGDPKAAWATRLYGRPKDYRDPRFLEILLTEYGLHPAPGAVVFVEGETELDLFPKIGELIGYTFDHFGIELELLGGVTEALQTTKLVEYLARPRPSGSSKMLRRPFTTPYVVVDNEGVIQRGRYIGKMRSKGLGAYLHVWEHDLERDNFSATELARAITETFSLRLPDDDVERWMTTRVALDAWLEPKLGRRVSKRALVPALVRIITEDLDAGRRSRPVIALVWRIIQYAVGGTPVPDPRRDGFLILGR